jgi:hypothetical protein
LVVFVIKSAPNYRQRSTTIWAAFGQMAFLKARLTAGLLQNAASACWAMAHTRTDGGRKVVVFVVVVVVVVGVVVVVVDEVVVVDFET